MPDHPNELALDIDLQGGIVPISKAASSLAALLKRAHQRQQPIVVTQKGYPTGVLLPIDLYVALRARAVAAPVNEARAASTDAPEAGPEAVDVSVHEPEAEVASPVQRRRGGRRKRVEET